MAAPHRVHNFGAGPSAMPVEVLEKVRDEMLDYRGTGMSVMEMSHRSAAFAGIIAKAEADLRKLLGVPDTYSVLFLQGGAWTQFAAVPLNLVGSGDRQFKVVDYLVTGSWSRDAAKEAARYARVNVVASSEDPDRPGLFRTVPPRDSWKLSPPGEAAYLYYCANETVMGVQVHDVPQVPDDVVLVGDFSSCFLSGPLDVTRFGVVYAGAQKNVGPAGLVIVIVRKDLLAQRAAPKTCPTMLSYKVMADAGSMYNTPPCWSIYVAGLVFEHLLAHGGLEGADLRARERAAALYAALDRCPIAIPHADAPSRSLMNVVFRLGRGGKPDPAMEGQFVKQAEDRGLVGLAGHRSVGGLRASLYNAMTQQGVEELVRFLDEFAAATNGSPQQ